jgi:hypothetical protein
MPYMKTLDTLIALVVVILVLSLIVQSVQGMLKKLFKIKSRQLEDSLLDLFENALGAPSAKTQGVLASSPVLRVLFFRQHPSERADPQVKALFDAVSSKFKDIGRVAQSGRWVLDSLAKDDLLKVMARVAPGILLPEFLTRLEEACQQVGELETTLQGINGADLSGEASARLAAVRQAIDPLINDVRAIFDGKTGKLNPSLLVGDAFRLRQIKLEDVLAVMAELQKGVDRDLAAARASQQGVAVLETASNGLKKLASQLSGLHARFDAALAPLRTRLVSVETWFDTVMQSFDERYARGMRTWALVISLAVVVVLDAGFFKVARQIVTNPAMQSQAVKLGEGMAGQPPAEPGSVKEQAATYKALGFKPLSRASLAEEFQEGRRAETLAGWLLMTLLLSVGAPFWQDTLESLFGLKNLLRKRGDIQNVERQSGAGNPKSS